MRFKEVLLPALLLILFLPAACGREIRTSDASDPSGTPGEAETTPGPIQITDDAGRRWTFAEPPVRVLSLVPAGNDLLVALGLGDRLVGRTDFDSLPDELRHLPSVGGGLGPSIEALVSVAPDLVIRFEGPSDLETAARLDRLGIPHLAIRPDGIADIFRIIGMMGTVMDRQAEAGMLQQSLAASLDSVAASVAALPRVRVAILLGGDPPWAAGERSFIHELVTLVGGENVLAGAASLYAPISVEEVRRRAPDLLILTGSGRVPAGLQGIPYRVSSDILVVPGPRLGEAAAAMASLLHADAMGGAPARAGAP